MTERLGGVWDCKLCKLEPVTEAFILSGPNPRPEGWKLLHWWIPMLWCKPCDDHRAYVESGGELRT